MEKFDLNLMPWSLVLKQVEDGVLEQAVADEMEQFYIYDMNLMPLE